MDSQERCFYACYKNLCFCRLHKRIIFAKTTIRLGNQRQKFSAECSDGPLVSRSKQKTSQFSPITLKISTRRPNAKVKQRCTRICQPNGTTIFIGDELHILDCDNKIISKCDTLVQVRNGLLPSLYFRSTGIL